MALPWRLCMSQKCVPKINRPQMSSCCCKRFRTVESKLISIHLLNGRAELTIPFNHESSSQRFSHYSMRWWSQSNEKPITISLVSLWINLACGHLILSHDIEMSPSNRILMQQMLTNVNVTSFQLTDVLNPRIRMIAKGFTWVLLKCISCICK